MKALTTQQEILLVTNTTLSEKQWCEKGTTDANHSQSSIEQLEEACWNGLLDELFPEVMLTRLPGKRLYLWHVRKGSSCLQLEWSEFPLCIEKHRSINPAFFLLLRVNN
jgi:hypothetical protein